MSTAAIPPVPEEAIERSIEGSQESAHTVTTGVPLPISSGLEDAIERALACAARHLDPAGASDTMRSFVAQLRRAVLDTVDGRAPKLSEIPDALATDEVLKIVRQSLIFDSQVEDGLSASEAVRVLSALGRVQALHDRLVRMHQTGPPTLHDALGPVVEVAHDMRSPLAAILFLVDMLRSGRSGPVSTVQQQQLRLIHSATLGLNQVACDLIDYVHGTARYAEDGEIEFSITGLLQSVLDIVQPMAEDKGVTIELLTPDADTRLGHPSLISRVILNLTSNAIRYADRGAVLVSAREQGSKRVEFAVRDQGRTIPDSLVPHLFEPFRPSAHPQSRAFSSSGLGLAVSHRLVSAMDGVLSVESTPSVGTRFHFVIDLPRALGTVAHEVLS